MSSGREAAGQSVGGAACAGRNVPHQLLNLCCRCPPTLLSWPCLLPPAATDPTHPEALHPAAPTCLYSSMSPPVSTISLSAMSMTSQLQGRGWAGEGELTAPAGMLHGERPQTASSHSQQAPHRSHRTARLRNLGQDGCHFVPAACPACSSKQRTAALIERQCTHKQAEEQRCRLGCLRRAGLQPCMSLADDPAHLFSWARGPGAGRVAPLIAQQHFPVLRLRVCILQPA